MNEHLAQNPVHKAEDIIALRAWQEKQRKESSLIADNSVDLVVSNCVLNLVHDNDKEQLIREIFRVVKPGGREAISDIVSDECVHQQSTAVERLYFRCPSGT
jgi:arsenite methyltransferase